MSVLDDATSEHWAMVEANMGLVGRHVAARMRRGVLEVNRDDMFQDGLFGLLRAAMKFDPSKGFTFATYADAWIRQAIDRGRGTYEGRTYRAAAAQRGEWERPLSIDEQYGSGEDGDPVGLVDVLPSEVDVEGEAMWALTVHELHGHADDAVDHDVADMLARGQQAGDMARIAGRHGVSHQTVRTRRRRLLHRAGGRAALVGV